MTAAGCAGHVLDYDDTYTPGLVHATAPVAPAALLLAAELGPRPRDGARRVRRRMGGDGGAGTREPPRAVRTRMAPDRGLRDASGAAIAAARLLDLDEERTRDAAALALLRAGGLRAAFGSPGKAIQVGGAAAAGLQAARLAAAGARAPLDAIARGPAGFEAAFGGRGRSPAGDPGDRGELDQGLSVLPRDAQPDRGRRSRCAAAGDRPERDHRRRPPGRPPGGRRSTTSRTALQAKFSIPYLTAFALLHGAPGAATSTASTPRRRALARDSVRVAVEPALGEMAATIESGGETLAQVETALGSPARPMDAEQLRDKLRELAGERLDGMLDDLAVPAADVVAAAGLT